MEKECKVCRVVKPLTEFYRHPRMADGHLGKCKECQKAASTKARANDIERYREYDRNRAKLPKRIEAMVAQTKKWRREDVRRAKCHSAVARALRRGDLVPAPCARCGREDSQAHHEDYDRPLDVVWLCPVCHKARHKEMRGEK